MHSATPRRAVFTLSTVLALGTLVHSTARAQETTDSAAVATAFMDDGARVLLERARARLKLIDRSIQGYEATAVEKYTVRVRALRRDRMVWGREVATRIDWERDGPVRMEVLGAREVLPIFVAEPQVPSDLQRSITQLAFDPSDPYLIRDWFDEEEEIFDPLREGREARYRYRSGGTRTIRLPDGTEIRLVELQIFPREASPQFVEGSFWLDDMSYSPVQSTFRLSAPVRFGAGPIGTFEATLEYATVEYGLWELQWWLPRLISVRGVATGAGLGGGSLQYERVYSDYEVDGLPQAELLPVSDSIPRRRVRCPIAISINVGDSSSPDRERDRERADSASSVRRDTVISADPVQRARADSIAAERAAIRAECERYEVVLPPDSIDLARSDLLTDSPFDPGQTLMTDADIEAIRERLEEFSGFRSPLPEFSLSGPLDEAGLIRYNRVEGLSLGIRGRVEAGPFEASATARIGSADREPNGRLEFVSDFAAMRLSAAAYRDLTTMDPEERPFALGASVSSLFFAADDADYFRALGAELRGEPSLRHSAWYDWRLYAQRETAATKKTDFSFPNLFDSGRLFPENEVADEATQFGAGLRLRRSFGNNPLGLRVSTEIGAEAALGTFESVRPFATLRAGFPFFGPFVAVLEGSAGTTVGEPGAQHRWRLGGPATVRGYQSGQLKGEAFWRSRAEVGTQFPMARLVVFSDAGWAGEPDLFELSPRLLSVGAGVSLLDGIFRLDLARALKAPEAWRLTAYIDGWL